MPKPASALVRIPADFSRIAAVIYDHGGEVEATFHADMADLEASLGKYVGQVVTVEFEYGSDPLSSIIAMRDAIKGTEKPMLWAVSDAFEERSRGERALGRLLVLMDGTSHDETIPYEFGKPDLDERTLRAAGLSHREAADIEAAFTSPQASPAP